MSGTNSSRSGGETGSLEPLQMSVTAPAAQPLVPPRKGQWRMWLALAICVAPVLASYITFYFIKPTGRTNYSELIRPTRALPALAWRDLDGRAMAMPPELKGQWLLVVAAPSQCPSACEKQLWLQRQLVETLGREKDRVEKVVLILDEGPLRPELQRALLAQPGLRLFRLAPDALRVWMEPGPAQAWESHLYVVDPMGQWMLRTPAQPDAARVKKDLEKLLRASASWDRAGR
jgi:hypothetical protein